MENINVTNGISEQLISVYERVKEAVIIFDSNFKYMYINSRAEQLLQKKRESLLGKCLWEEHPEIINTPLAKLFQKALKELSPVHGIEACILAEGLFEFNIYPSENSISTHIVDLTYQTLIEEELLLSNQKTYNILDTITDAFCCFDNEWRYTNVNSALERFIGINKKDLLGKVIWDIMPCGECSTFTHYKYSKEQNIPIKFEAQCLISGGWFEVHAYPSPDGLSVFMRDISSRKKAEKQTKEANDKIARILEGISDGFFALDNKMRLTYVNGKAEQLYRSKKENLIGKNIFEVFPKYMNTKFEARCLSALFKQKVERFEIEGIYQKNRIHEFDVYPLEDGLSIFLRDVTQKRKFNKEISRLNSLNLIGQLSAGISHEIRNPLTSVKGFLQMFSTRAEYQKDLDFFKLMIEELDRANNIITEYLSLARDKSLQLKPENLNEKLDSFFPLLLSDAFKQDKNLIFEKRDIPSVLMDVKQIRQLVLNLVRNGLEAIPPGGTVILRTYMENSSVILEVSDDGPGIPEEVLDQIGTPFLTTKENGTGLGLAICYSIASKHNATIEVNTSKKGTTFYIRFQAIIS